MHRQPTGITILTWTYLCN